MALQWARLQASSIFKLGDHGTIRSRLAHGVLWSLVGAVASQAFSLVAQIIAAHILGKSDFGRLGIINNTAGMFGVLAGFGLGLAATKFIAQYRITDPERAGRFCGFLP